MAKIYETQKDFERDKLAEQAQRMNNKSAAQSIIGLMWMGASFVFSSFGKPGEKPNGRAWPYHIAIGAAVLSIIQAVRSFITSHKAHDLELERERLGPETVILPSENSPVLSCGCKGACCCNKKRFSEGSPRSLLEQAMRTSDSIPAAER